MASPDWYSPDERRKRGEGLEARLRGVQAAGHRIRYGEFPAWSTDVDREYAQGLFDRLSDGPGPGLPKALIDRLDAEGVG